MRLIATIMMIVIISRIRFTPQIMANARVQIIHEVTADGPEWKLCLQWCRYFHDGGDLEEGYRFMWRRPDGSLQAARGPSPNSCPWPWPTNSGPEPRLPGGLA